MENSSYKSLYSYLSLAHELEYSHVHMKTLVHELEHSSYTMVLVCSYLFFIFLSNHIAIGGGSACCLFGGAHMLVRPSVGWGAWGHMSSDLVCGHGARILGIQWGSWYATVEGVGGRVVTALSVLVIPPRSHTALQSKCPCVGRLYRGVCSIT